MSRSAVLALKITGDASGAKRAFNDADDGAGRFSGKLAGIGAAVGVALGAVAVLGKAAFDSASNLEQQAGAVDAVFGKGAAKMHAYAREAATTVGLAQSEYSELASVLGSQLGNAGFAGDKLTGTVDSLVTKGADLAAQFGGSTAEAVEALSSVLKGETDPIEKYGVSVKQSDITARLAAKGQDELTGAALKNATAQAALALVTEQTKTSQGAFGRESDTAAGKMQTLSAMFENGKAKLGAGLLPVFVTVANFVTDKIAPAFETFTQKGGALSQAMTKVGTFIKEQVVPALKDLWKFVQKNILPIFADVADFILANVVPAFSTIWDYLKTYVIPIFKTVLKPALEGVRSAFKVVAEKVDENRDKFAKFYENMKPFFEFLRDKVAPFVGGTLKNVFKTIGTVIGGVIDSIAWILEKGSGVVNWLFGGGGVANGTAAKGAAMLGAGSGSAGGVPLGSMFGAGGLAAGSASSSSTPTTVVHITVEGALDPVAVGRQIDQLVRRYATTVGRTSVALGGV